MTTTIVPAAVTALETATAATEKAQKEMQHTVSWASRSAEEIESTKWTCDIEAALGKPDELVSLRVRYDEKALTFMSAWLNHYLARSLVMESFQPLCEGIREVIALHDTTTKSFDAATHGLPPFMQSVVLRAIAAHRTQHSGFDQRDSRDGLVTRAYDILVETFSKIVPTLNGIHTGYCSYTTDLVVQGRLYQSFLNADVDLRNVYKVRFVDCVNSQHPHSQKLVELMEAVEAARDVARAAAKKLKGEQNGSVNERQHANRMLDLLHGKSQGCGTPDIDGQVKAQNERRLNYEIVRSDLQIAIANLQELRRELVRAFVSAGYETDRLLKEMQAERHNTVDRELTVKICMNNVLAADVFLRRIGREIAELQSNEGKDLSLGNGRVALAAAYENAIGVYRPFKTATAPAGTEG